MLSIEPGPPPVAAVDGQVVPGILVEPVTYSKGTDFALRAVTAEAAEILARQHLSLISLPKSVFAISIKRDTGLAAPIWIREVSADRPPNQANFLIKAWLRFDSRAPSVVQRAAEFAAVVGNLPSLGIGGFDLSPDGELHFSASLLQPCESLHSAVQHLQVVIGEQVDLLATPAQSPALHVLFDFPANIRTSCEQYLIYFGEFLRTLGSGASIELRELADQVLFSVVPHDGDEALQKIAMALAIYLRLAGVQVGTQTVSNDIETSRLCANIAHLQSQLLLAHARGDAQAAHIRTQEITIDLIGHARTSVYPLPSESSQAQAEFEPLTRYITVSSLERGGLKLHFYQVLRDLKKLFH